MGRPEHKNKRACIDHVLTNPTCTYAEAGAMYGASEAVVGKWMHEERKKKGTAVLLKRRPPKIVNPQLALPAAAPKALPRSFSELAKEAVRIRLVALSDPALLAQSSERDIRETLKMLTDTYVIFPSIEDEVKSEEDENTPISFMDALKRAKA